MQDRFDPLSEDWSTVLKLFQNDCINLDLILSGKIQHLVDNTDLKGSEACDFAYWIDFENRRLDFEEYSLICDEYCDDDCACCADSDSGSFVMHTGSFDDLGIGYWKRLYESPERLWDATNDRNTSHYELILEPRMSSVPVT